MFWNALFINWTQYDVDELDANNYCLGWYKRLVLATVIGSLSEFSIIIINSIIAVVLTYLSEYLKRHTTIQEQKTGF